MVAYFAGILAVGLSEGGHLDEVYRRYGEPHHALARVVGLGIERVTISGIDQMREGEVLAAAGVSPKVSLALPQRRRNARPPEEGAADPERVGPQALSQRARRSP